MSHQKLVKALGFYPEDVSMLVDVGMFDLQCLIQERLDPGKVNIFPTRA